MSDDYFREMSLEQQLKYLEKHPNSKKRPTKGMMSELLKHYDEDLEEQVEDNTENEINKYFNSEFNEQSNEDVIDFDDLNTQEKQLFKIIDDEIPVDGQIEITEWGIQFEADNERYSIKSKENLISFLEEEYGTIIDGVDELITEEVDFEELGLSLEETIDDYYLIRIEQ